MLVRIFSTLLVLALLPGCNSFNKDFQKISYECGLNDSAGDPSGPIIKIVHPDGQDLTAVELETARGRFLAEGQRSKELQPTPKGCFSLPQNAGIFQVFTLQGLHLSRPFHPQVSGLQIVPLERTLPAEAELVCPAQGYYVNRELSFPIRLTGSAAGESSRIRLVARNVANGEEAELFMKDYGATLASGLESLDTSRLPDGTYDLRLEALAILTRWDAPILPLNGRALCPLSVLHETPSLTDGTELIPRVRSFYKKDDLIPWTVNGAHSELRFCREPRGLDEDELNPADDGLCQPKTCLQSEAFQTAAGLRADTVGVFDYFFFAENRAGVKSEISCQRIVVSDSKPLVHMSWGEPSWNRPMAIMEKPRASFTAEISVQHPQRADSSLRTDLSCKLDFLLDGTAVLPGRDALCLTGRCRGRRLDQYVPCDHQLTVSLQGYWKEQKARPVLMRLHVKASDGAGHIAETAKSVWIHPQRWKPEAGTMMPTSSSEAGAVRIFQDKAGLLFAHTPESLMRYEPITKAWEPESLPFAAPAYSRIVLDHDRNVYVAGQTNSPETGSSAVEVFEKSGSGWKPLSSEFDLRPCLFGMAQTDPLGGFLCIGSESYLKYQADQWQQVFWPLQSDGTRCFIYSQAIDFKTVALDQEGGVIRACPDGSVYRRSQSGDWVNLAQNIPSVISLTVDQAGRIWALQAPVGDASPTAQYFAEGLWTSVDLPKVTSSLSPALTQSAAGAVLYYDYLWDEASRSWQRLSGLDDFSASTHYRSMPVGAGKLLLYADNKLLLWDAGEITQLPLSWYGIELREWDINPFTALTAPDQGLWVFLPERPGESRYRPILIPHYRSNTFGPEVNLFSAPNESRAYSYWVEKNGALTVLVTDRGLIRSGSEGWAPLWSGEQADFFRGHRTPGGTYFLESNSRILRFRGGDAAPQIVLEEGSYTVKALPSGKVLVNNSAGREGWIYDDSGGMPLIFPEESLTIPGTVTMIGSRIIWSNNTVMYRLDETKNQWEKTSLADLNLPTGAVPIAAAMDLKAPHSFVRVNDQLMLVDASGAAPRPFALPGDEFDAWSVSKIVEVGTDDFLILIPSFGIYRGDGRTWKAVLLQEELQARLKMEDRTYFHDMQLDAFGRLWVAGEYFRLLALDL